MGLLSDEFKAIEAGDALAPCRTINVYGVTSSALRAVAFNICVTRGLSVPSRTAAQTTYGTPSGEQACRLDIVGCSAGWANDQHGESTAAYPSASLGFNSYINAPPSVAIGGKADIRSGRNDFAL